MKKKNLLKCLALTSMLALSVGAVTSCGTQGEAGKDGAQGAQGAQGAKGEQGDKGEDGKTYLEVIVVPGVVTGGTIEQDKYYVQAGESFTLTFKDSKGKTPEVVFDFMINGAAVTVEPGAESYTYTATASDTGFQITSAKFGTVETYADNQILAEVLKLWSTDKQLYLDQTAIKEKYQNAEDFIASDYYAASSSVWAAYEKASSDATKAIGKLDSDATVAEKVAAAKTAIEAGVKAVDAEYKAAVEAAQEEALNELVKLDGNLDGYDGYVEADRTAINTEAKAAVKAATTLEGLSLLVDSHKDADGYDIAKYTHMLTAKKASFEAINSALSDIPDGEPFDATETDALDALKLQLEAYGVSIDNLPSEVAKTWEAKVSSEKDFPVYTEDAADDSYSKGQVIMAVEAYNAVSKSYTDLKSKLKDGIIAQYNKEINASKVLGADGMTTMRGVVNSAVNTWINTNDSTNAMLLKDYLSASAGGLIEAIENGIADTVTASGDTYKGFVAERQKTALDSVIASLKAEKDSAVSGDSLYASYIGKKVASGTYKGKYIVQNKAGVEDDGTQFANPLVDLTGGVTGTKTTSAEGNGITKDYSYIGGDKVSTGTVALAAGATNTLGVELAAASLNVQVAYDAIVSYDTTGKLTGKLGNYVTASTTPLELKALVSNYVGYFTAIHNEAVKQLIGVSTTGSETGYIGKDIALNTSTDNSYLKFGTYGTSYVVTAAQLEAFFVGQLKHVGTTATLDYASISFSDVNNAMSSIYQQGDLLTGFDSALKTYANKFFDSTTNRITDHTIAQLSVVDDTTAATAASATDISIGTNQVSGTKYYTRSVAKGEVKKGLLIDSNGYVYKLDHTATDTSATTKVLYTLTAGAADFKSVGATLVSGTKLYKAALDATNSGSIISKILSGSYSTSTQIKSAVDKLDSSYEDSIAQYIVDAKAQLKDLFITKNSALSVADSAKFTKVYNAILSILETDYTSKSTGAFANEDYAIDSSVKSLFVGKTFDSVNAWYESAKTILSNPATYIAAIDITATVDYKTQALNTMLMALLDEKVVTLSASQDADIKACIGVALEVYSIA